MMNVFGASIVLEMAKTYFRARVVLAVFPVDMSAAVVKRMEQLVRQCLLDVFLPFNIILTQNHLQRFLEYALSSSKRQQDLTPFPGWYAPPTRGRHGSHRIASAVNGQPARVNASRINLTYGPVIGAVSMHYCAARSTKKRGKRRAEKKRNKGKTRSGILPHSSYRVRTRDVSSPDTAHAPPPCVLLFNQRE